MTPELARAPDWVRRIDLRWIEDNYEVFQSAVRRIYDHVGRGAVVVDVAGPLVNGSHPFSYWPQSYIQKHTDPEVRRLVQEYSPREELIVMLMKPDSRMHTYRVGPAIF